MRTEIDVVSGFFESGKTSLINNLLRSGVVKKERIVVLLCEQGGEQVNPEELHNNKVFVKNIDNKNELNRTLFINIKKEFEPDRVIIEYNGTWGIGELLKIYLPPGYRIGRIVNVADASTFALYMKNMAPVMTEPIYNSDCVLFNRYERLGKDQLDQNKQAVRNINKNAGAYLYKHREENLLMQILFGEQEKSSFHKFFIAMLCILLFFTVYLLWSISGLPVFHSLYRTLQTVNTMFIGILLQAVPFMLIGIFVSSFLQVFVSEERLIRLFLKKKGLAFPLSAFLGVLLPVCDCAMVPIASGLARKGLPLPYAVTFLLAAPAVNPVVISSTLFAFPGQPQIAVYRIILGLVVAVSTGFILSAMPSIDRMAGNRSAGGAVCSSGYLSYVEDSGLKGKQQAVFRHAGLEFLNIGRFVVVGAFISTIIQVLVPKTFFTGFGGGLFLPFAIMTAAAFLMSVCSTSNAFIARSFSNSFPAMGVLGFMVLGPMLDLKNLMMLSGSFSKRFIVLLVCVILCVSFMMFYIFSQLM